MRAVRLARIQRAALRIGRVHPAPRESRRDRERRLLLRAELDTLGGVGGALARHAEGGMRDAQVALDALPTVLDAAPGTRLLVAGPGDTGELLRRVDVEVRHPPLDLLEQTALLHEVTVGGRPVMLP